MVHKSKDYKHAKIACFYKPHGSPSMLALPIGELVGLSLQQQTMMHMELSLTCDWDMLNRQSTHTTHEHVWLMYE